MRSAQTRGSHRDARGCPWWRNHAQSRGRTQPFGMRGVKVGVKGWSQSLVEKATRGERWVQSTGVNVDARGDRLQRGVRLG